MNKKLKVWMNWLYAPMAIGFYVTLLFVWLSFLFYTNRDKGNREKGLIGLVHEAHLKSIDYRLQVRGPQKNPARVGLLTVDEKAVQTVGRWPWPREILAQAIDQAFQYNTKVLAFDIIFSEPAFQAGKKLYEDVKSSHPIPPETDAAFQAEIAKMDGDKALAEVFKKHGDKIVAGAFYQYGIDNPTWPGSLDFCYEMVFRRTQAAKTWDQEEVLISVQDTDQQRLPSQLTTLISDILKDKEAEIRSEQSANLSKKDQVALDFSIDDYLSKMCETILDDYADGFSAVWTDEIRPHENPNDFAYPTYADWLADYRAKSMVNAVPVGNGWVLNTPEISSGLKHTGYFNADLDHDGSIRSKVLVSRTGNSYFPALALKAYLVAENRNASLKLNFNPATTRKEVEDFEITDNETGDVVTKLPTDGQGRLMINYAGPQKMYPHISFAELLTDSEDAEIEERVWHPEQKTWEVETKKVKKAEFLKDRIFIVGATATGIYDLRVTPFEKNFPGAETHANVIGNLITRNFLRAWEDERTQMPIILLVLGFTLSILLSQVGAIAGILVTIAAVAIFTGVDKFYLFDNGVVVTIIWPLLLILVNYITLMSYRYLTEERGKKELRQTFQKYVSPAIVEEILSDPKNIELGGRKINLTVSFSDVRGFTTISEKLDPRALSDLLNSYLTPMTDIVFKNRGTLDKYMGDAIMAFFGAPIGYKDHAKYACRCALLSVTKLFELQKEYERKGLPTIDIGIGLNTGDVSVGNMGSETVRSYTVMGDAVNLASRLEGINKTYGTRIILSEFTYNEVKADFVCREVDWVRVKGKLLPVKIYELISEGKAPDATQEMLKWFQEGYTHYHNKSWQGALDSFAQALNVNPEDPVSKIYVERCQEFLAEPPSDDWDGVFVMKTK